jgi:hypothetical protein
MISSTMPSAKFLLRVAGHVLEWQDRNRWLVGKGKRRTYNRGSSRRGLASDPVRLDRLGDVLHLLLAKIGEGQRQLGADLIPHCTGDANPARLRKSFQAGSDIHGVAEEIVALNDDVADVQPDAEPHLLTGRSIRIRSCYCVLHRDSTLHGIHGAGEIGDESCRLPC